MDFINKFSSSYESNDFQSDHNAGQFLKCLEKGNAQGPHRVFREQKPQQKFLNPVFASPLIFFLNNTPTICTPTHIHIFVLKFKYRYALPFLSLTINFWLLYSPENKSALGHSFKYHINYYHFKSKKTQQQHKFLNWKIRWGKGKNIYWNNLGKIFNK